MRSIINSVKLFKYSISLLFSSSIKLSLFFIILVILQGLMPTLSVLVGMKLGNLIGNASTQYIFFISVLWVITFIIPGILSPIVTTLQSVLNQKATYLTQKKIMEAAARINDLRILEDEDIHNDFEALSNEASNKPLNLLINLVDLFRDTITLMSLSIVISSIIWWLPFALLLPAFPVAIAVSISQKDIFKAFAGKSRASRLIKYYISVLLNPQFVKEIKIYQLAPFFIQKHSDSFHDLEEELNAIRKKQIMRPQIWNMLYAVVAICAMYTFSQRIASGDIAVGALLGIIQAVTYFALTCQWGVYSLAYIVVCFEFFRRLYTIENLHHNYSDEGTNILPEDRTIRFEHVYFAYHGNNYILKDVSFEINVKDHLAIIGENGAGKSTIIKLLCRLYQPNQGKITMGGIDIQTIDLDIWHKNIATVFQDFGHYILSVEENIYLGDIQHSYNQELLAQVCRDANFELPKHVNFSSLLGKEYSGAELSGGQWQRLALARAFYGKQRGIIILDEPTSALDPRVEAHLFDTFQVISKNKTAITVTHRLGSIKNATKIIVLKAGEVIEQGDHLTLLENKGEYYSLLQIQKSMYDF